MRIGILTSDGDAPGLNALIRSVVLSVERQHGGEAIGFRNGWQGLRTADLVHLDGSAVRGLALQGGTLLGSSYADPLAEDIHDQMMNALHQFGLSALIAAGGRRTFHAVNRFAAAGLPIVGIPTTITNDLRGTRHPIGFSTAVEVATQAIDRIRTTAESHARCIVVEVPGSEVGWLALESGLASGTNLILVPEKAQSFESIACSVMDAARRGNAPIVIVSEGFRLSGAEAALADGPARHPLAVGKRLSALIEQRTGIESRSTALRYMLRGGEPTAFDRLLATRYGTAATDAVQHQAWGCIFASHTRVEHLPSWDPAPNHVPPSLWAYTDLLLD